MPCILGLGHIVKSNDIQKTAFVYFVLYYFKEYIWFDPTGLIQKSSDRIGAATSQLNEKNHHECSFKVLWILKIFSTNFLEFKQRLRKVFLLVILLLLYGGDRT